ncbi:MAG: sel1 repeat family protein, partial [Nitrosospira sp.]|nr:sel1 repeat family protein [Nitrosospira sp.]
YNIGVLYAQGHGVTQNYKEAVKWYRLAAVQEDAVAQYSIGVMYHNGQGVTKDYIRAHMWYNLSSLSGYANGTKDRDLLAKEMTPQQIEKAQNMARECEAKDFKEC